MRIGVVCEPESRSFTKTVVDVLRTRHEVVELDRFYKVHGCDLLWIEWARQQASNAIAYSNVPAIIRMHRYEAFLPWLTAFDWSRVSLLIVPGGRIRQVAAQRCPSILNVPWADLPVLIDTELFAPQRHHFQPSPPATVRIGVVGNVNARKNPWGWVQVMEEMLEAQWTPELHVLGQREGGDLDDFLDATIARRGLDVTFYDPLPNADVPSWWADKDFCLSTAWHEGVPVNVREAAACGVRPLVYHYPGAGEQLPKSWLFDSAFDAAQRIRWGYTIGESEQFIRDVEERWSVKQHGAALLEAVEAAAGGRR